MKSIIVSTLLCMACAYLIGTLNPAYLIAKLKGFDIREVGSGNAGASNAVITMGKAAGLLTALFDITKAYVAVRLARRFFPNMAYAAEVAGVFTVLGHIFPFAMGFRGGKGLASMGGVILAFNAKVFCLLLLSELLLALVVDYICIVPITASIAFPIIYYYITAQLLGALLYALLIPVILYKHMENLKRIRMGTEAHLSFLWRREEEIARITNNRENHI